MAAGKRIHRHCRSERQSADRRSIEPDLSAGSRRPALCAAYQARAGGEVAACVDAATELATGYQWPLGIWDPREPIAGGLIAAVNDAPVGTAVSATNPSYTATVLVTEWTPLDAQVGEGGVLLSGGERQRLAIARALLMAPAILLLDESTSSLDGLNEQLMKDAIDRVSANRTLIVIAHRLSTVIDSDQIVVLDKGRVLGVGTHDELVADVPLYRELAETQLLTTD